MKIGQVVKEIFFENDIFTLSKSRVLEFCKGYTERGIKTVWACKARVNSLNLEAMKAIKKASCRLLITGYESGSDEILRNVEKGVPVYQIKTFTKNAKKARFLAQGDIIFGLLGEIKDTIRMTKDLIKETRPEVLQVSVASPFSGTEFHEYCINNNFLLTNDPNEYLDENSRQEPIISYLELTNEEMVRQVNPLLKKYYLSPSYVPLAMRQVLRKNPVVEVKKLWFSANMFLGYAASQR